MATHPDEINDGRKSVLKRIAAIDLGTNSFHSVLVDIYDDGSFYTIDRFKEMVLLSEKGVGNHLSEGAMDRGIAALQKIKTLCDHQNVDLILAYATSAIREADNGGDFIQRAIDEVGLKINAIPGRLEAEMIGYAIRHAVKIDESPVLMMDVGGGSTEFLIGNINSTWFVTSLKVGVARMASRFITTDPVSDAEISQLRHHFSEQLKAVTQAQEANRVDLLIGSSGTMENIAQMIARMQGESPSLSLNELEFSAEQFFKLYKKIIPMDRKRRAKVKGLEEKRVDLIVPGLVLVDFVIRNYGISRVKISDQALREGIVLRHIKREMQDQNWFINERDPRRRSIYELLRKCDWHKDHSNHVAGLAVRIFDELKTVMEDDIGLMDEDRELLHYAALMHDIGYHISHRKHHQHALYLIRNADLKGFREVEIEIMANVARYHRRSTPKMRHKRYKSLSDAAKERVRKLSGILRVADGLDRSHYQNVQDLQLILKKKKVIIEIETEADPQLEIWGAMRKATLFEEITGRKLVIREMAES